MRNKRLIYVLEDGRKTYSYGGNEPEIWTEKEIMFLGASLKSGTVFGINLELGLMGDMNRLERAGIKGVMAIVDYETEDIATPINPNWLRE